MDEDDASYSDYSSYSDRTIPPAPPTPLAAPAAPSAPPTPAAAPTQSGSFSPNVEAAVDVTTVESNELLHVVPVPPHGQAELQSGHLERLVDGHDARVAALHRASGYRPQIETAAEAEHTRQAAQARIEQREQAHARAQEEAIARAAALSAASDAAVAALAEASAESAAGAEAVSASEAAAATPAPSPPPAVRPEQTQMPSLAERTEDEALGYLCDARERLLRIQRSLEPAGGDANGVTLEQGKRDMTFEAVEAAAVLRGVARFCAGDAARRDLMRRAEVRAPAVGGLAGTGRGGAIVPGEVR